jgi:N12 class adenine-specific DNA methylase
MAQQPLSIVGFEPLTPAAPAPLSIVGFQPLEPATSPRGPLVPGNIDLFTRPAVKNPDGTSSTVRSMSFEENGKEILIPTVVGTRVVSDDEAIAHYRRTGQHLGIFATPDDATAYGSQLHDDYAAGKYAPKALEPMRPAVSHLQPPSAVLEPMRPVASHAPTRSPRSIAEPDGPTGAGQFVRQAFGAIVTRPAAELARVGADLGINSQETADRLRAANDDVTHREVTSHVIDNPKGTLGNPMWWAETGGQVVGSVMSLMAAGGRKAVATVAESAMEGSAAYDEARRAGADPATAGAAAAAVIAMNLPWIFLTNAPLFDPATKSRILNAGLRMISEGTQEAGQEVITDAAAQQTYDPQRPWVGKGTLDAAIVGGVVGPIAGVGIDAARGQMTAPPRPPPPGAPPAVPVPMVPSTEPMPVSGRREPPVAPAPPPAPPPPAPPVAAPPLSIVSVEPLAPAVEETAAPVALAPEAAPPAVPAAAEPTQAATPTKPYRIEVVHVTTPEGAAGIRAEGFDIHRGQRADAPSPGLGGDHYGPGVYLADYQRDMASFWRSELETKNFEGIVETEAMKGTVSLERPFHYVYNDYTRHGDIKGRITPRQALEQQRPDLVGAFDAAAAKGLTERRAFGNVLRAAGYDGLVIEHRAGDEIVAFDAKSVAWDPPKPKAPVTPQLPPAGGGTGYVLPSFVAPPATASGSRPASEAPQQETPPAPAAAPATPRPAVFPTGTPNEVFKKFKTALTRAQNAKDWPAVIAEAERFKAYYDDPANPPFPDDWRRWEIAGEDAARAMRRAADTSVIRTPVAPPTKPTKPAEPAATPPTAVDTSAPAPIPPEDIESHEYAQALTALTAKGVAYGPGGLKVRVVQRADGFYELEITEKGQRRFDGQLTLEDAPEYGATVLSKLAATPTKAPAVTPQVAPPAAAAPEPEADDYIRSLTDVDLTLLAGHGSPASREKAVGEQARRKGVDGRKIAGDRDAEPDTPRPADQGPLAGAPSADDGGVVAGGDPGPGGLRGAGTDAGSGGGRGDQRPAVSGGVRDAEPGVGVPADGGGSAAPAERPPPRVARPRQSDGGLDYRITEADRLGQATETVKIDANLAAIRLLKTIQKEGRRATAEEQKILVQYVGWGAFAQRMFKSAFGQPADKRGVDLKSLLTDDEYDRARASTQNAHYTSPAVIQAMYAAVQRLGFDGGRVLEPAVGIGHFFGLMPTELAADTKWSGVELDAITAGIAQQLYQTAHIENAGLEDAKLPLNFFDLAISNVPFGDVPVHDKAFAKRPKALSQMIHNYFFAKGLDLVRPGGLVAFITADGTMDGKKPMVREYLAKHAELLGAIRLPKTAFEQNAGTEVVTDIIFLKKRETPLDTAPAADRWVHTGDLTLTNPETGAPRTVPINQYFLDHPEMVVGQHSLAGSMRHGRGEEYTVLPPTGSVPFVLELAKRLMNLPAGVYTKAAPPKSTQPLTARQAVPAPDDVKKDAFTVKDGKVWQRQDDELVSVDADLPVATKARVVGMVGIRQSLFDVMRLMLSDAPDAAIKGAQRTLNRLYDAFVKKHGYLSEKGNIWAFDDDPDLPRLLALEEYDAIEKTAKKADIFTKRTLEPPKPVTHVDEPDRAMLVALNETGRIDWERMAQLTGQDRAHLQEALRGLVYKTPAGPWETADEYLSGDVKTKLEQAEAAAKHDPLYLEHVEALKKVIPEDIPPSKISLRLGAGWVPTDVVQDFIAHLLHSRKNATRVTYVAPLATWVVAEHSSVTGLTANTETWGTPRANAIDLISDALNLKTPTVYDTSTNPDGSKSRVLNQDATQAAREKQQAIKDEWQTWFWADTARRDQMLRLYNDTQNRTRRRTFNGAHLDLPGMAILNPSKPRSEQLRPHQKDGIWRSLQTPNMLAAHVVGAGKTYLIVGSAMEKRRQGTSRKPVVGVPNHLVTQWARAFADMYPLSNVLSVRKKDFQPENRKRFMAKIATGDWDAVIIPHSVLSRIPLREETYAAFFQSQLDVLEEYIEQMTAEEGKKGKTVKQLEAMKKRLLVKMQRRADRAAERTDDVVRWEELGIDSLYIDEAHLFKNLWFPTKMTRVAGLPNSESDRAFDMLLKVRHTQKLNNGGGVFFATGTPVSNTMAEMFTMQRYLQPDVLEARGLSHFDAWAQMFGDTMTTMEVSPEGKGFRMKTSFSRFSNMGRLSEMFRSFADVKTAKDLNLPIPKLKGGVARAFTVDASPALKAYVDLLTQRAEAIRAGRVKDPRQDNMLKITSEGRKGALDMRLLDLAYGDDPNSKLNAAVKEIYKTWEEWKAHKGTQLVFSDMGTPKKRNKAGDVVEDANDPDADARAQIAALNASDFNLYDDVKAKLVKLGVPAHEIAFIHDANTDVRKQTLFDNVNAGKVRILIGSTEKMGAGMNVQRLLVRLHQLDAPWRPSDVEQRVGRILRQGNHLAATIKGFEVEVTNYITKGSFDAYIWQTLERKARMIEQGLSGLEDGEDVEDVGGGALNPAEMKAAASDNPMVLEKTKADAELRRLESLRRSYDDKRYRLESKLHRLPQDIAWNRERTVQVQAFIAKTTKPDPFTIRLVRALDAKTFTTFDDRAAASAHLALLATQTRERALQLGVGEVRAPIGSYAGHDLVARHTGVREKDYQGEIQTARAEGEFRVSTPPGLIQNPRELSGWIVSLDYAIFRSPDSELGTAAANIEQYTKQLADITEEIKTGFPHAERIEVLKADIARIDRELDLDARSQATAAPIVDDEDGDDGDADPQTGGGGRSASIGTFAPHQVTTATPPGSVAAIRPLQFPELVALARELASTPRVVKAFRSAAAGDFDPSALGGGTIRLHAGLFKAGHEAQLAATLAHEIGHLADWLPHRTLKRGNILGRLFSLRSFLKGTFTTPGGDRIKNTVVRAELLALSNTWRPWDEGKVSASFRTYRVSASELYADAISVLLNNPGLLAQDAPTFYEQFFEALDAKPDVKAAYFGLQDLLAGTPEELIERRRAGVREMFEAGDTKAMDLERLRQAEALAARKDLWLRTRIQHVDKNTPLIDRVKALEKRGVHINQDDDPRYFLEERNYLGGKLAGFTKQHFQPIYEHLTSGGVDWHTFGEALFYERIIAGDRSEVANPRGLSPADAQPLYDHLTKGLDPEQRRDLKDAVTDFRKVVRAVAKQAYQAGLYTDELYEQMLDNPAYVTFRVIEHLESDVTSRVYKQIGTLKDVTNPADATMLKVLVTLKAIEQQRMKVAVFDFLTQHFPSDIAQATEIGSPKGRRPIESRDRAQQLLTYYEQGRLRGKYVDQYIADSVTNASVGQNLAVVGALRFVQGHWFRPVFTTVNLGFQGANFLRDVARLWKNTPGLTFAQVLRRYKQAVPFARVRAFGLPQNASATLRAAETHLVAAEHAKILSVTFNDLIAGREVEDTQIEDTLAKYDVGGFGVTSRRSPLVRPFAAVLTFIEQTGNFIETLPKAAAIYEFTGKGSIADISPEQRSFIRRKIGSPDFLAGGTIKPLTNEVALFSNAITQAIRADLEVATQPKTRSGFWWKTAALNLAPKLAIFGLLYGLGPGDDEEDSRLQQLRRALRNISEYDLTNYLSLPIYLDANGNTHYLRLPQDDAGRMIGGLFWKALQGLRGDRDVLETAAQVFDYLVGQAPGASPVFTAVSDVVQASSGRNVYDSFRGRFLFTDDELKAGGWQKLKKFVGYEFQQLGGGIVWKFYPGELRPRVTTTGQKILELPVLSAIVGRFYKISNFGQTERLREVQADVQQDEARTRLTERTAVHDALRTYQGLPAGEQTIEKQRALAQGIVSQLYPPERQAAEYRDVLKKMRMGLARGQADPLTDAVLAATSNAQKVAVILKGGDGMAAAEVTAWLQRATQEQVVSPQVRADVMRQQFLNRRAPAAPR